MINLQISYHFVLCSYLLYSILFLRLKVTTHCSFHFTSFGVLKTSSVIFIFPLFSFEMARFFVIHLLSLTIDCQKFGGGNFLWIVFVFTPLFSSFQSCNVIKVYKELFELFSSSFFFFCSTFCLKSTKTYDHIQKSFFKLFAIHNFSNFIRAISTTNCEN